MRREGFELSVSPPRVVYREEDGVRLEPVEEVVCEVLNEHAGDVIAMLNNRKGEVGWLGVGCRCNHELGFDNWMQQSSSGQQHRALPHADDGDGHAGG